MTYKTFKIIRLFIIVLVAAIVATAVSINNFYLALAGLFVGLLFNLLVRSKFRKKLVDERIESISGQASRMTYIITTIFLALLALFLVFSGRRNEDIFIESLGVIFSYIAILNTAVYAISFHYFNKKHGGHE
jgi:uncharacterized membrane protein